MPIVLTFKPKSNDLNSNDAIVKDFPKLVLSMPFLSHQGAGVEVSTNPQDKIVSIKVNLKGISVCDSESSNMIAVLITEKLDEAGGHFYLAEQDQRSKPSDNEAVFLHDRFCPIKSRNAKHVEHIKSLEIPEEFCCPLSGDIMDEPISDIRNPGIVYDYNFLMYWLNKSHPKLMPHTKLPFDKCF